MVALTGHDGSTGYQTCGTCDLSLPSNVDGLILAEKCCLLCGASDHIIQQ